MSLPQSNLGRMNVTECVTIAYGGLLRRGIPQRQGCLPIFHLPKRSRVWYTGIVQDTPVIEPVVGWLRGGA